MRVGFIGLGNVGAPMAGFVVGAGFSLVVHDLRREAAAPLLARGATWADSPREVAAQCDVVCVCVPGPPEMTQTLFTTAVSAATRCQSSLPGAGGWNNRPSPSRNTARSTSGRSSRARRRISPPSHC